jgi:hypothetical protein
MSSTDSDLVCGEELARWLGVSRKEIYDLGKAGILVRVGRAYRLEEMCAAIANTSVGHATSKMSSCQRRSRWSGSVHCWTT